MAWFQSSEFVLERKCLGLLALPLITLNGLMRSANNPLGNALEHFCGYNYQHHTLDKFLRELKYLGISYAVFCLKKKNVEATAHLLSELAEALADEFEIPVVTGMVAEADQPGVTERRVVR